MNFYLLKLIKLLVITSLVVPVVLAAGLDDLNSYKKPVSTSESVSPYEIKEILSLIPKYLDENGVFQQHNVQGGDNFLDYKNPKTIAFNMSNFEKCDYFYIGQSSMGNDAIVKALIFSFPENNDDKEKAGETVKYQIKRLENPNTTNSSKNCKNLSKYVVNLKSLLNSILENSPSILKTHQDKIKTIKINEENKLAKEKSIAQANASIEAKKQADSKAKEKIETVGKQEKQKKLLACKETKDFKLYDISQTIVFNSNIARGAQQQIDDQKEGAKV